MSNVLRKPCVLGFVLKTAYLVRNNYDEGKKFFKDPTLHPPRVFEGYLENIIIIIFIYLFYSMNLDPRYPFFVCESVDITDSYAPRHDM